MVYLALEMLPDALRGILGLWIETTEEATLTVFEVGPWNQKLLTVAVAWHRAWGRLIPFFVFRSAVRRLIYTTNATESVNSRLRKILKTRGHFPSYEAATKLIWLALRTITAKWGHPARDWEEVMNRFAILYEERFTAGLA